MAMPSPGGKCSGPAGEVADEFCSKIFESMSEQARWPNINQKILKNIYRLP